MNYSCAGQPTQHCPSLPRRSLLTAVALGAPAVAGALVASPAFADPVLGRAAPPGGARPGAGPVPLLDLPAPTGAHPVGTAELHLVDGDRADPLAPTTRPRELVVRLWYPARASGRPRAPYLPAGVSAVSVGFLNAETGAGFPADLLRFPTASRDRAPALAHLSHPVLVFSPGLGLNAAFFTGLHEELASHGYVVAGIDHTFDAAAVEFPDGRLELQRADPSDLDLLRGVRAGDIRFVLDQLFRIADGANPDAARRPLPYGLGRALDLTRTGAYGYSLGSASVVGAVAVDRRIHAGAALDGSPLGPESLDRAFLLMGNQSHRRVDDPDWAAFYDRLRGPRLHLVIDSTRHADLSDVTVFKDRIDLGGVFEVGDIDGLRAMEIQRRYLTAWFDRALRDRRDPLLRGESARFPEVDFQP